MNIKELKQNIDYIATETVANKFIESLKSRNQNPDRFLHYILDYLAKDDPDILYRIHRDLEFRIKTGDWE